MTTAEKLFEQARYQGHFDVDLFDCESFLAAKKVNKNQNSFDRATVERARDVIQNFIAKMSFQDPGDTFARFMIPLHLYDWYEF